VVQSVNVILVCVVLSFGLSGGAAAQVPAPAEAAAAEAKDAISLVRTAFGQALKNKSLPAMKALFYEGRIEWRSTGHPASRREMERLQGSPEPVVAEHGAHELLENPVLREVHLEETFGPAVIDTDGQMAVMSFNYDFRTNGAVENWGRESWQMVKTDAGWKILSLLYSYHLPEILARPSGHTEAASELPQSASASASAMVSR
jgi:hypothetical protein